MFHCFNETPFTLFCLFKCFIFYTLLASLLLCKLYYSCYLFILDGGTPIQIDLWTLFRLAQHVSPRSCAIKTNWFNNKPNLNSFKHHRVFKTNFSIFSCDAMYCFQEKLKDFRGKSQFFTIQILDIRNFSSDFRYSAFWNITKTSLVEGKADFVSSCCGE